MKSRWQKSLESAVATYEGMDTQMPWSRGLNRKASVTRRESKPDVLRKVRRLKPREPQTV